MSTVSVLLPVYNTAETIATALRSVSTADQLVVVDDASTDQTPEILAALATVLPLTILRHPFRLGVTAALRTGLAACTGTYVARQDADDQSLPERLGIQRTYLDCHQACALVASRVVLTSRHTARLGSLVRWFPAAQLWFRNPIVHGAVMFRREVVEQVGGYREPFGLAQDLDLWLRVAKVGALHILPMPLYVVRDNPNRLSLTRRSEQRAYAALARWANT